MAYTYREAIKTAYKYLNIDEELVEVINNTNGRGIVYTFDNVKTVIFIYPISCKQNNKQNFFDTRDSGAKERAITWKYAIDNNLRYFCFGFNEEQERYRDYVLSLESDERAISDISFRKSENSESTGTQVNIPNDFIPNKKFERIKTPKGFYIAAIRRENISDYISMFDSRPYQKSNADLNQSADMNEYQRAAKNILSFIDETNFQNPIQTDAVEQVRNNFLSLFSIDRLQALSGKELLDSMFFTEGDNTNSLCCYIEMNQECRNYFGGIAGGSAYKFGLFKKKQTGEWTSGSPNNPIILNDDEALAKAVTIRDALIKGVNIIQGANLNSLDDYEKLDAMLKEQVGEQFYNWAWFHKYFAITCPDKLSCYHNAEWQKHILYSFGIKPSDHYYARSGQIAMIENYAGMYYRQFFAAHVACFGRPKSFYRIGTTKGGASVFDQWKAGRVAGIGWNDIGTLKNCVSGASISKDILTTKLREIYYPSDRKTASRKAGELARFYETDENSIFVAADGEILLGLFDQIGDYYYDSSAPMAHLKPGAWHLVFDENERLPNKTEGLQTSCIQIKDETNLMFLYDKYYNIHKNDNDAENSNFDDEEDDGAMNTLKNCLEITRQPRKDKLFPIDFIIYGAPGTGKTYSTAEYALAIIENRPVDLSYKSDEERIKTMMAYNGLIHDERIVFTTFHQSYGYEEFIQGLRPDTKSEKMSFVVVDGVFKRIADKALNDLENNYVIIIDEINRANISKVFGELISLIEEDKRWGEINQLCATLQSGDVFAVPNNLYIVGTMNSADKSISLIDAALRRRFDFVEQKPLPELISDNRLRKVLVSLNTSLADELESADLLIGHSYFMNKTEKDLETILNNNIIPLLYEYFYDNKKKVASVLSKAIEGTNIILVDDKMGRLSVKSNES